MKKTFFVLVLFVFSLTVVSQKFNYTDVPIEGAWLFKFGDEYAAVLDELRNRYPDNDIRDKDSKVSILDVEFAGITYNITTLSFIRDNFLYSIEFSKIYSLEHKRYAIEMYDMLDIRLSEKYGAGNIVNLNDNDMFKGWEDKRGMRIYLSLNKGLSKGGDEMFYVYIEYVNSHASNFIRESRIEEM